MNKLDKFEEMMRNSLDNYEVNYDPTQWNALNKKLGSNKGGGFSPWLAVAGAALLITSTVLVYQAYNSEDQNQNAQVVNTTTNQINNNEKSVNNTEENISTINTEIEKTSNTSVNENTNTVTNDKVGVVNKTNTDLVTTTTTKTVNDVNDEIKRDNTPNLTVAPIKFPQPLFKMSASEICPGTVVDFTTTNLPENAECVWTINSVIYTTKGSTFSHKFENSGNYIVALAFVKAKQTSNSTEHDITVKSLNTIDFTFEKEVIDGKPVVNFKAGGDASNFVFKFEDGTTASNNTTKFFRHKGLYIVTLSGEGSNACPVEVKKGVEIEEEYNLFAPSTFTPNGDGRNDVFIPVALTVMDVEFTMSIFTRDGKLVYQTNSANRPWDGRFTSDNQIAPFGAYVWVVSIKGEEPYKGSVTLMP